MDFFIVVLAILVMVFYSLILLSCLWQNIRYQTGLNVILITFLLTIAYGVFFDCYRLLSIYLIGFVVEFLDKFNYIVKVGLFFFSLLFSFQLIIFVNNQSGHKINESKIVPYLFFYVISIGLVTVINMFSLDRTNVNEIGFYTYQINIYLYIYLFLITMPIAIYELGKTRVFIKEVKKKEVYNRMIGITLIYLGLIVERLINIGYYAIFPNSPIALYFGILMLTIIVGVISFFFLKYPNYLLSISKYFSVKSIYLIKNNGQLLYEFDLQTGIYQDPIYSGKLLLGGFIYGITSGLEDILKLGKDIDSINFGDWYLIIKKGKYVFGVLLASEKTPMIVENLENFINSFENDYKDQLENWSGHVDVFNIPDLQNRSISLFR